MEICADTSAFNAGVKENNTKTNKIIIVKNRKLATQNFFFCNLMCFVMGFGQSDKNVGNIYIKQLLLLLLLLFSTYYKNCECTVDLH